jgi:hypothetical protein
MKDNLMEFTKKDLYRYTAQLEFVIYNGNKYYIINCGKGRIKLISREPLSENSIYDNGFYLTESFFGEIEEYGRDELFSKYKGHFFQVGFVSNQFANIQLVTAEDYSNLGFVLNYRDGFYEKNVTYNETEGLYYHEVLLTDMLKKMCPQYFGGRSK